MDKEVKTTGEQVTNGMAGGGVVVGEQVYHPGNRLKRLSVFVAFLVVVGVAAGVVLKISSDKLGGTVDITSSSSAGGPCSADNVRKAAFLKAATEKELTTIVAAMKTKLAEDPNNVMCLYGIAKYSVVTNKTEDAKVYVEKLGTVKDISSLNEKLGLNDPKSSVQSLQQEIDPGQPKGEGYEHGLGEG